MMYQCAKILFLAMPLWQQGCSSKLGDSDDASTKPSTTKASNEKKDGKKDAKKDGNKPDGSNVQVQTQSLEDQMRAVGQHLDEAFVDLGDAMVTVGTGLQQHLDTAHAAIETAIDAAVREATPTVEKSAAEIQEHVSAIVAKELKPAFEQVVDGFQKIDWAAVVPADTPQKVDEIFTKIGALVTSIGTRVANELKEFDADNKLSDSVKREMNKAVAGIKTVAVKFAKETKTVYKTAKNDVKNALQSQELHDALVHIEDKMHTIFQDVVKNSKLTADAVVWKIGKTVSHIGEAFKHIGPEASFILDEMVKAGKDIHQVLINAVTLVENADIDTTVQKIWADIGLKAFEMTETQLNTMMDSTGPLVIQVIEHLTNSVEEVVNVYFEQTKAQEIVIDVGEHLFDFANKFADSTKKMYDHIVKNADPIIKKFANIVEDTWSQIMKDTDIRKNLMKVETFMHKTFEKAKKAANNVATHLTDTIDDALDIGEHVVNEIADVGEDMFNEVAPAIEQLVEEVVPAVEIFFKDIVSIFA